MKAIIQRSDDGDGILELPDQFMRDFGLAVGDTIEVFIKERDGCDVLALRPYVCSTERTVVEDRYHGAYSGAAYVAWPLSSTAIPSESQGKDIEARLFWSEPHLVGKGSTPDGALQDLETQIDAELLHPEASELGKALMVKRRERIAAFAELRDQVQRMVSESGDPTGFDVDIWLTRWLAKPIGALNGATPNSYLDTLEGRALVTKLLAQMGSGAYG